MGVSRVIDGYNNWRKAPAELGEAANGRGGTSWGGEDLLKELEEENIQPEHSRMGWRRQRSAEYDCEISRQGPKQGLLGS